jgi:hypothetical protein
VTDLPIDLAAPLAARLAQAIDAEGKIVRGLEALGPIRDRDVVLIGIEGGLRARELEAGGARLRVVDQLPAIGGLPAESADVVVAWWSAFRGVTNADLRLADGVLRPHGRLLVVHDYGRDDVSRLRGDQPEYGDWSRRDGPFLRSGFRIRVLHCWWTFGSIEEAQAFLGDAFGERGVEVGAGLKRPRLSYNVAVYHRTRGDGEAPASPRDLEVPV